MTWSPTDTAVPGQSGNRLHPHHLRTASTQRHEEPCHRLHDPSNLLPEQEQTAPAPCAGHTRKGPPVSTGHKESQSFAASCRSSGDMRRAMTSVVAMEVLLRCTPGASWIL